MKYINHFESTDKSVLKETFNFDDVYESIDFIRKACDIFENADHHPYLFCLKGKQLEIHLTTDSEGGVTDKDKEVMDMLKDCIS